MPHIIRKPGILGGTTLAVFMTLVHTVNDAITAILGALLPTLQLRFDVGPTVLALMVAVFWIASSVTQPVFGALGEDTGLRVIGCAGVLMASTFLSLIGVASELWLVFLLLVIGGLGSAALHPVGTTIAGSQASNASLGVGLFTAGGMVGFALGPVVILYLVSTYGTHATIWLAVPGLVLGVAVGVLLPQWEPIRRRRIRRLFDLRLALGPLGLLALASMFSALTFVTFTGSVPLWLVEENGYASDAAIIGWTLSAFAFAGGLGSILGGFLAPRLGPVLTIVGAFLLALVPLLAVLSGERADHHRAGVRAGRTGDRIGNGSRARLGAGRDRVHRARARSGGGWANQRDSDRLQHGRAGGDCRPRCTPPRRGTRDRGGRVKRLEVDPAIVRACLDNKRSLFAGNLWERPDSSPRPPRDRPVRGSRRLATMDAESLYSLGLSAFSRSDSA